MSNDSLSNYTTRTSLQYGTATASLDFSRNSVNNTRIAGSGFEFEVVTPELNYSSEPRITSVYRYDASSKSKEERVLIGEIDWNLNSSKSLVARIYETGQRASAVFESSRTIMSEKGERYRWEIDSDHLIMYNISLSTSTEPIAIFRSAKRNLLGKQTRPARLQYTPAAISSLDKIVLSLLVVERGRRDLVRSPVVTGFESHFTVAPHPERRE